LGPSLISQLTGGGGQVAEESFISKLVIPKTKAFRNVMRSSILGAGPCIRSEVVFRHKGKLISKVPCSPFTVVGHAKRRRARGC
jgi:hypothetical protein